MAALRTLRQLQAEDRPATAAEQAVLARWSGWGAVPEVFDDANEQFAAARAELRSMLDEREWRAASKTTLNAHHTDAALAQAPGLPATFRPNSRHRADVCPSSVELGVTPRN